MLRIKEGVNLEILKNYGFVEYSYCWACKRLVEEDVTLPVAQVLVIKNSGTLTLYTWELGLNGTICTALDVLYELIQSGIVEKMEDENE